MRRRLPILGLVVAVLAALAGGPSAQAGVLARFDVPLDVGSSTFGRVLDAGELLAGPVLSGGTVVWAQEGTPRGTIVLRSAPVAGGAAAQTVATLAPVDATVNWHDVTLQGSPTRLAVFEGQGMQPDEDKYMDGYDLQARLLARPPGGPLTTVAGCDRNTGCGHPACFTSGMYGHQPALALSGDVLAFADACAADGVSDPFMTATLRRADLAAAADAAAPQPSPVALGTGTKVEALTGELIATRADSDGALAVRRTADGTSLGAYPALPGNPYTYPVASLQADGKLAAQLTDHHDRRVVWAAPGDPRLHRLGVALDRATPTVPRIGGDRVVLTLPDGHGGTTLAAVGLGGDRATPLLRAPARGDAAHRAATIDSYTFDGTRVAWAVTQCEHVTIGVSVPGDAPLRFTPQVCDTPRVISRTARADRRGRYVVSVTCARACSGTLRQTFSWNLRALTPLHLPGARHPQRVALRLPATALRALRRHRVLEVYVDVPEQRFARSQAVTVRP